LMVRQERSDRVQAALRSAARPLGQQEIAVHAGDDFQLDFLGAHGFAFADVGAASEAIAGGLRYHRNHAGVALRLALRQQTEMRDLGAHEERRRGVGAHGYARAAANARGRIHGSVGGFLRNQHRVAVGRAAGGGRYEPAGGDQAVERAAVHHQVFHHRERARAPRLQVDLVAVLELAHVKLAQRRAGLRAVRPAVDYGPAPAADALAAIVVERHGFFALGGQVFVQAVEHLQERHVRVDVRSLVTYHAALVVRVPLTPDMENDSHYL